MPITRTQFELEIDAETEEWMKKVYMFLKDHKDEAFTSRELAEQLNGFAHKGTFPSTVVFVPSLNSAFELALEKLSEIGAADTRVIREESYYRLGSKPLPS